MTAVVDRSAPQGPSAKGVLGAVLAVLVLTGLGLLRFAGRGRGLDLVYADDSRFLEAAMRHGAARSFGLTYEGYLHSVPRLVANLVALVPMTSAAVAFGIVATVATACIAVYVFHASSHTIPSPAVRGALAVAMVVLPAAREEVVGNVANLQWPLLFACFWALTARRRTSSVTRASCGVAILTALSCALSLLLLPLAVLDIRRKRSVPRRRTVGWWFVGSAVFQFGAVVAAMGSRPPSGSAVHEPMTLLARFADRVGGGALRWPTVANTEVDRV